MNNQSNTNYMLTDIRIGMNAYELAWHAATMTGRRTDSYINHVPENLSDLTVIEKHLLINDNNALGLDHV